jgi:hypothetical protein
VPALSLRFILKLANLAAGAGGQTGRSKIAAVKSKCDVEASNALDSTG